MKTMNISLGFAMFLLAFLLPEASQAYFTTAQNAVKISDSTALFTIEYVFGHEDRDYFMPIAAKRGLSLGEGSSTLGYSLRSDEEVVVEGTSAGMVLSKAPIENGMYRIEKGTAEKFVFFVLLSTLPDAAEMDYSLHVEHLPFVASKDGLQSVQKLNQSELQYYATNEVELNTKVEL